MEEEKSGRQEISSDRQLRERERERERDKMKEEKLESDCRKSETQLQLKTQ